MLPKYVLKPNQIPQATLFSPKSLKLPIGVRFKGARQSFKRKLK